VPAQSRLKREHSDPAQCGGDVRKTAHFMERSYMRAMRDLGSDIGALREGGGDSVDRARRLGKRLPVQRPLAEGVRTQLPSVGMPLQKGESQAGLQAWAAPERTGPSAPTRATERVARFRAGSNRFVADQRVAPPAPERAPGSCETPPSGARIEKAHRRAPPRMARREYGDSTLFRYC
jgi:hypothetical protein